MKPQNLLLPLMLLFFLSAVRAESPAPGPRAETAATEVVPDADRAATLLEELAAEFRAMDSYAVAFDIAAGNSSVAGGYTVQGNGYRLELGDAEVFCDGQVRYEVDHARREVTIDAVDPSSRNLLDNPVRAFDFLGGLYTPQLLGEHGGQASIRLTPTDEASVAGAVTVTLSLNPVRPLRIVYDYDGEQITVSVLSVAPFAGTLHRFDPKSCAGYEFIDFR